MSFGTKNNISLFNLILLSIIPYGPLYARVFKLNGSLDKKFLLPLLFIPIFPFQFINMLLMYFGYIKPGPGKTKPYDNYMIFPIIIKLILPLFINRIPIFYNYKNLINLVITIIVITILNINKRKQNCKDNENDKKMTYIDYLPKAILDAFSEHTLTEISGNVIRLIISILGIFVFPLNLIIPIAQLIGSFVGIDFLSIIQSITSILGFNISYILINMINFDNLNKYCNYNINIFNLSYIQIIITIIGFISMYLLKGVNKFI